MSTIHMFVSYSHEDDLWVREGEHGLIPWLAHQLRRDDVQIWYDHALRRLPGIEYEKLIKSEIDRADFAVLLISQDFAGSDFIRAKELPWIRQRVERNEMDLITVLVGHVLPDDLGWLAQRQMLPGQPTPLIDYTDSRPEWQKVRNEILEAFRTRSRGHRASAPAVPEGIPGSEANAVAWQGGPGGVPEPPREIPPAPIVAPQPAIPKRSTQPPQVPEESSRPRMVEASTPASPAVGTGTAPTPAPGPSPSPSAKPGEPRPLDVITNSIGMKLVLIPPGEFLMGSPETKAGRQSGECPQHRVQITRPFYLGMYQVTQAEYEQLMGENRSRFKGATRSVENVSWEDAVACCRKLSEKEGQEYRLPTEAEWEYACRAGSTGQYCLGDDASQLGRYAWYGENAGNTTHPVGQKEPNAWGLYDMHGNVWEWCQDQYRKYASGRVVDPTVPEGGSQRVVRGGSWRSGASGCRASYRHGYARGHRDDGLGFRLVRIVSSSPSR